MRLKVILGNLIAVLVVGLVSYFVVKTQIESNISRDLDGRTEGNRQLFERSWQLSSLEFLEHVKDRAATPVLSQVFAGLDEQTRRTRAYQAIEQIEAWFRDPQRGRTVPPDFVAIVDETGRVISRNKDINRMYRESLASSLPWLGRVTNSGSARSGVWNKTDEQKLLQAAVAPILKESGTVLGALVVAYDISNEVAGRQAMLLGRDIAFVTKDRVYSSSLPPGDVALLKEYLFEKDKSGTDGAIVSGSPTNSWLTSLQSATYLGMTARLPDTTETPVGYVLLANRNKAFELVSPINLLFVLTILGGIFVVIYGTMLGTQLLAPIEQMEEGVLKVINGNTDIRLDIESEELGGLAYRINQLINVFTGVSEDDSEGRISTPPGGTERGEWKEDQEGSPGASGSPPQQQ